MRKTYLLLVYVSLSLILVSCSFAQWQATRFTETAQKAADAAAPKNTPPPPPPRMNQPNAPGNSNNPANTKSIVSPSNPVKSTFLFDDNKPMYSPATEIRAIWITRGNYKNADDIKKIVENCAKYNLNMLVFQVRGSGTVYYKSKIEPWAYELTSSSPSTLGKDPGWDPLKVAVEEAHKNKVELIAWLNTFPGWTGKEDPKKDVSQLWNNHPEWFMVDSAGKVVKPGPPNDGWYRFITPTIPEVQDYVRDLYTEVVRNYDVDGIHFDYVRYPGEIGDFGYDSISLALFRNQYHAEYTELPELWAEFRRDGVFATVDKTYHSVNAVNPKIKVTAAVLGRGDVARKSYYTSARDWLFSGIMDITMPMGYTGDTVFFRTINENHIKNASGRYVAPGIGVGGRWANNVQLLDAEIQISRDLGGAGVTFFAYNGLFPKHQPNELAEYLLKGPFSKPAAIPVLNWKK